MSGQLPWGSALSPGVNYACSDGTWRPRVDESCMKRIGCLIYSLMYALGVPVLYCVGYCLVKCIIDLQLNSETKRSSSNTTSPTNDIHLTELVYTEQFVFAGHDLAAVDYLRGDCTCMDIFSRLNLDFSRCVSDPRTSLPWRYRLFSQGKSCHKDCILRETEKAHTALFRTQFLSW